jgi:transcription initiation factor IIE alpha subunit
MMVKVVSTPNMQTTCYKCKSVLEYTFQDTKEKTTTDYLGGRDTYRGFVCPVCGSFVSVEI